MENQVITHIGEIGKTISDLFKSNKIKGENMADLSTQLIQLSLDHKLILRDEITGNIYSSLSAKESLNVSEKDAYNLFMTYIADKVRIKTKKQNEEGDTMSVRLNRQDSKVLFDNLLYYCTYNSREKYYKSIPKWDGTKRIATFMHDYFKCDTNPSFFWLYMTAIIGKIKEPSKCYVPYFFDFVGHKGVGKTLLHKKMVGSYANEVMMKGSRKDDLFVEIYGQNLIIPIDDECSWVSNDGRDKLKFSYDEFKSLVTTSNDTFSRKFGQPESHERSFIIVRTSNQVNQVWSTDERRQIIFETPLDEKQCLIWDLPDSFFQQMLAEAKDYYEKNGIYKLQLSDWEEVNKQNKAYYNTETMEYTELTNFIKEMHNPLIADKYKANINKDGVWCNWQGYANWMLDNNRQRDTMQSRMFWRTIEAIAGIAESIEYSKHRRYRLDGENNPKPLFRILSEREMQQKVDVNVNF